VAVDSRNLIERVADHYRAEISSGRLKSGDTLPPEQDIADQHEVSRGTVRQALAILTNEGLLTSGRGRGRQVRSYDLLVWEPGTFEHKDQRGDQPGTHRDAWRADVAEQGREGSQEVEPGFAQAPDVVAERLGIEPKAAVAVRRRVRLVDGTPYQLADSYYPRDIAEGTPILEPGDVTIPGGLMTAVGHEQVRYRDELRARMPTKDEASRLNLMAGTPVTQHVRTGFDKEGRAVRVIITIVPGDRHVIVYDVSATS